MTPPPRLHVLTALGSDQAIVLRRGPTDQVAVLMWDRSVGTVRLGQWLGARIHEHRCDLSPSGRHLVYFACKGGRCWTAVSKAPWLTAIAYWPQSDSWFGGGAFTADGRLWLNGATPPEDLPDGLRAAEADSFPNSTDGFHMGDLVSSRLQQRGWVRAGGEKYEIELRLDLVENWSLRQTFTIGENNRAHISSQYALLPPHDGPAICCSGWEWADRFGDLLQWAENGKLWQTQLADAGGIENRQLVHDFTSMQFEAIQAPYSGVSVGEYR
ncbi:MULTISPECIES: hypothetical protein [unclassified Ruegeria]|uniref:hypothetical protein n=2 Tax=Ruegeria TaxID=97050 RepID=UPI0014885C22|nr:MULTISPECIES: hypothetical protein [unclassified Ruegeria]NOD48044.1 hypothetical protein [Ruegeria sp. HKCCD5849]NOD53028.1 hypothetical protein [Ruegeria sp. HKCCD5851]NOD69174.1 hypothetical protein [Ruegeria sp. HKCCD7303]NOE35120.1 hypothetical protein [Ruegeria sp. HKCCD7318]